MKRRGPAIGAAIVLICSGALAGCGSADESGPSTRPAPEQSSATPTPGLPVSLAADSYCGTLGNIVRFASGPSVAPEVAKRQFADRFAVLTQAYQELADLAPHRGERRRWAELADASASVIDFYAASGKDVASDGMILKLAEWKTQAESVLLANQTRTVSQCGITASHLAGYPIENGAPRG